MIEDRGGPLTATQAYAAEEEERRYRRLFDEMARNIGREAVNHLKTMYPEILSERAGQSKSWKTSLVNHIRNDINFRMMPLLEGLIAYHKQTKDKANDGT